MKIYTVQFEETGHEYIPEVFWTTAREAIDFAEKYCNDKPQYSYKIIIFTKEGI